MVYCCKTCHWIHVNILRGIIITCWNRSIVASLERAQNYMSLGLMIRLFKCRYLTQWNKTHFVYPGQIWLNRRELLKFKYDDKYECEDTDLLPVSIRRENMFLLNEHCNTKFVPKWWILHSRLFLLYFQYFKFNRGCAQQFQHFWKDFNISICKFHSLDTCLIKSFSNNSLFTLHIDKSFKMVHTIACIISNMVDI